MYMVHCYQAESQCQCYLDGDFETVCDPGSFSNPDSCTVDNCCGYPV